PVGGEVPELPVRSTARPRSRRGVDGHLEPAHVVRVSRLEVITTRRASRSSDVATPWPLTPTGSKCLVAERYHRQHRGLAGEDDAQVETDAEPLTTGGRG